MKNQELKSMRSGYLHSRTLIQVGAIAALVILSASSALITKAALRRSSLEPLTSLSATPIESVQSNVQLSGAGDSILSSNVVGVAFSRHDPLAPAQPEALETASAAATDIAAVPTANEAQPEPTPDPSTYSDDTSIRWFNGRPVRPARTMTMVVTAYSPDARSCGPDAHGITSSVHNVYTNGMKLVAADTGLLPLGSMITVPGYDEGNIVPVLDRGGAIKGHRLDVLYPTHEVARQWGVKKLKVTVWEYADGRPADDIRKIRDSKE